MLDHWIDNEPQKFVTIHRGIGYGMLALVLMVYHLTTQSAQYQLYIPLVLLGILIALPALSEWLEYHYPKQIKYNSVFLIDCVVAALSLAALHLSLVPSFAIVAALLYSAVQHRIDFFFCIISTLIATFAFYLSHILIFNGVSLFAQSNTEITILVFFCILIFFGLGLIYQRKRIRYSRIKHDYCYSQMNRYMEFANQLSRYAPQQLWQSIMKGETEAKIEYTRKKMTIFFSDIQGFTELSETLIPDDLAFLLNDYLSHMTDIARQYEGTVDKFMGDAILIFFGDPTTQGIEQDAKTCVEMAVAMRKQMKILRERWVKMGYPALHIRMGISTGYCHVGNYGAAHRMAYTIVGRDANLAARLQSAAEVDEILLADDTYQLVHQHFLCVPKAPLQLKGIQGMVDTWQVVEKYNESLEEYQRWFDYEYKGFHLLLNLDEVQNFEYPELVSVLERMIKRIQTQQQFTNEQGVVPLSEEDIVDRRSS